MAKKYSKALFSLSLAAATSISGMSLAAAAPAPILGPTGGPGTYSEQNITAELFGDSSNYRIPALADLGDGVVLASWDGRPYNAADSPNPNSILMKRSIDGGKTWSETSYIAKGNLGTDGTQKYGYSDPSFVVDRETGKVFAFFVYSKNQGFWGSHYGNDMSDPNVMGAVVVESSDKGLTWSEPRDITAIAKQGSDKNNVQPGDAKATFAASGEGIQLQYGQYKGRLIQQFTATVRQTDGSEKTQAYAVYSDDHGITWKRGDYVGIDMDENKVVELSDGRVMLNSRDFAFSGYRKVAISTDGGVSYGPVTLDTELPDPKNNASIFRMHPNAAEGSADAQKLIFTHANNNANGDRINLSARVSCDDGQTWPGIRQFKSGFGAYSTGTALSTGGFGVFYEANYTTGMRFASFDEEWLNYVCAPMQVADVTFDEGQTLDVPVTITNQEKTAISGKVTVHDANGYTAGEVEVTNLAPSAQQTVQVPVTAGANARQGKLDAVFTATDGKQSRFTFGAKLNRLVPEEFKLTISEGKASPRDVVANPYTVGETVSYSFRVTNNSGELVDAIPTGGNMDVGFLPVTSPNCRWRNLADAGTYQCTTAKHTVTAEDLERGYFIPELTFTAVSKADSSKTAETTYRGEAVQLREYDYTPGAVITGALTSEAKEHYEVGDVLTYRVNVRNTSEGAVDSVPVSSTFEKGVLTDRVPNCRWRNLAAKADYTCTTASHTITAEDLERGYFDPAVTFSITSRHTQESTEVTYQGDRINLPSLKKEEPAAPETPEIPEPPVTSEPPVVSEPPADSEPPAVTHTQPLSEEGQKIYAELKRLATADAGAKWNKGNRPIQNLERGKLASLLYRAAGSPEASTVTSPSYRDVRANHRYFKEIEWLKSSGIYSDPKGITFRPQQKVKQKELATILASFEAKYGL